MAVTGEKLGGVYIPDKGQPALPTRLMSGLHYLKGVYALSDERVVEGFLENLYWQYFKMREEACQAMFAYIEDFYNTKSTQKRLSCLSTIQWLHNWYAKQTECVA